MPNKMTGEVPTKLRLVRCPKCRRVLPELPNVPVYQCGGCGIVLQAKMLKVASKDAEPRITEPVTVHKNELQNNSSNADAEKFSQGETLPLTAHQLMKTLPRITEPVTVHKNETQICNEVHSVDKNIVNLANKESTTYVEEDEFLPKDAESSTGFSEELMQNGSLVSSPDVEIDECVSENAESSMEFPEDLINHINVETCPEKDECLSKKIDSGDEKDYEYCKEKPHRCASLSGELVSLAEVNHLEHEEDESKTNRRKSLTVVETFSKFNDDLRSPIMFGSSPEDEILYANVLKNVHPSPSCEDLEQYHDRASFYNLERMSSINTVDNISALRDMPESPITRSYYGFYGSGSSCDGTDDQFPDRNFHVSRRNFEERESTNSKFLVRNDEVSYNTSGNSETQDQKGYFSSSSSGMRRPAHHDILTYENRLEKFETIGKRPRVPIYPRDPESGFSDGRYSNDEIRRSSHLPNKREYLEVEKMELLKKVHELQDQLNRTYISEGKQNGNFSRPIQYNSHPYHDNLMYNQEFGKYHEERNGSNQSRLSQVPFSSEYPNHPGGEFHLNSDNAKPDYSDILTNNSEGIKIRTDKLYLGKKHALPVAGGASLLLCYACSEVLQIPADFLLFNRKYHKLKCGSCSVILKFALLNKTHIARYVDHSSKDLSRIDPLLVDDFEPSFCKSLSTEEQPSHSEPQYDYLKRNFSEKNKSGSKKGNMFTNFMKNLGSVKSSSRRSKGESSISENEEMTVSANSPLHRLMGYQSATFLLKSNDEF